MASNTVPTENDAPVRMMMMSARYVSLEDALRAYLTDSNNSLGETLPSASNYPLYSSIGQIVYIQIWLDNPDQNTILSLKLNGVKYQAGGALQSFFVQDGDTYLNCVYVAVTIPANSYNEHSYEVTEIEYVEGSNVSQDGKAVLIDENNDTVTIGLPFEEALPTVSISNIDSTATTVTFDVNVSDEDGYVELVGGWLRVVIYNNNNEIIGQSKLTLGNNSVTFENLSADTSYSIMAFVLGDAHDSNGVYVHGLANERARTKSVISCELESEILYNEETSKYYPQIKVNATLADSSFTFTKVEVIRDYSTVVFTTDFDGSIEITENILNGREYIVKVYYKNSSNVEQSYQDYVYVDGLDYPNINFDSNSSYGLVDDAIMGLECNDGKYNIDNLTVKIFDEKSAQYIAESALYLLDNSTAISDLETLYNSLTFGSDEWAEAYDSWYKLSNIQETIDQYHSTLTRTDWENALAKGIYLYEFTYGVDEEFFKGANNRYYVILPDYQAKRIHDNSWQYIITGVVDNNDEQEVVDKELSSGWFEINPALTENDYLFAEYSSEQGKDLFYIDENNVLFLQTMSRNNLGDETHRALGYVYQIVLRTREEIIKVLWSQEAADTNIDEEAWLEALKAVLIAGEDPNSVFPLGDLEPITFDIDDIDLSDVSAGSYSICFTYKMYGKEYTEDHPYDTDGGWIDYSVSSNLPKATININTSASEVYGSFEIEIPKSVNNGNWYNYTIEVRNENEELIGTYDYNSHWEIGNLSLNYSIRIKLLGNDYYSDGEWSQWFVCSAAKCDTPTNFEQSYTESGVTVTWDSVNSVEKYIYQLNNGEEQETTETSVSGLKDGDTIKVKAVPSTESGYLESDYSEVFTVEDTRIPLNAPVVTFDSTRGYLNWEAVENAARYEVYDVTNGITLRTVTTTTCRITTGCVYIVKALPEDSNTYSASQSEEINTSVKLDTPQITISETGVVSFSEYHDIKGNITYVYVINNGEEQTSDNAYDVVTLNANDTIKVKVVCDATGYVESDWATATYEVEVGGSEPGHIETTIEELVSNKPTEEKTVIYEVTAFWILKDGGAAYGNGWLNDGNGNEVYVYGLCSDSSVLTYENGAYTYQNNQSYSSLNLVTGSIIKVGMVYSLQYDNYMAYVIEIVDLVETVQISSLIADFDEYTNNQVAVTGIVYAADKNGLFIMDNSGNSLYVLVGYSDVSLGQTVTFTGVTYQYYSLPEFKCVTYTRGEIVEYNLTLYSGTISRFIEVNNPQFEKVFTHNVYRLTGILIQDGNDYYLTYDQDRIQIKSSTLDNDYTNLNNYIGQNISINVVLVDYHSTLEVFRVIPLVGEEANIEIAINKLAAPVLTINESGLVSWQAVENAIMYEYIINEGITYVTDDLSVQLSQGDTIVIKAIGDGTYTSSDWSEPITYVDLNAEPEHIETTVANLVNNKPTEEKTVIYEVTAYWTLKDGGSTYGNGWLYDGQGNQITVYGLCASDSVLTWSNGAYTYQNNQSYSSTGINDGDMITVGMVYSVQYDNYMCYLIEIINNSTDAEPEHIETTVANLVNNLPTEEKTVIYEVTAYWTLKDGGSTYGNGWLHDGQGNQITVYGLCASDSVLTWSNGAYTYQNNQSYSSTGINDGDMITVGMVYSVQYDNYMCYLIEIVEEAGSQTYIDINFIMINDTHGAFTDSSEGNSIGRIDTLVESLEVANGDYIFIHNGDAFQGSYVCGETYGLAMIEALNASGVDCFVIGNHEFDWGIDKIAAYRDGDLTNGEANFPFLGANIYYKGTTTRPEWLDAYTIIEQDGVKVGIIGIMGPDQETSILNRYVKDYDFVEPLEIVQSTSAYLRDDLGCDVVVVATHDYDSSMNSQFAQLSGSSIIDAIFCAHTHENIYETVTRSDSKVIPVVQCYHKNVNAAEVVLKVNEEYEYTSHSATKHQIANMNTNPTTYYYEISTDVQTIIDSYQDLIDESNEVIGSVAGGLTKDTLGAYAVDAMLNYAYSSYEFEGIDMAIMNTGGVRATIDSGDITRAEVFEVFPFNNSVVLVNISGALIKEFYGSNSGYMYMDMDDSISSYIDLDDDTIYQLAVIDYVFENTRYEDQFGTLSEEDYIQTDLVLRDLLMNYLDAAY